MSWRQQKETEPLAKGDSAWRGDGCEEQREAERPLQLPKLVDGNHLMVRSASLFKGGPRTLEVPEVVGFYSVDSEKKVHFDDSAMSVLSEKYIPQENERMKVELDLNKGKDQYREFTTSTTDIFRQFLQWILKNQKELTDENSPNKLKADIVVARVILQNIMEAPYASSAQFSMILFAQYFKGSIYIDYPTYGDDDDDDYDEEEEEYEEIEVDPILGVYGHKFEQYMTGGDPNEVVHCNRQFRCVLKQHLNEMTLLHQITTDAIDRSRHQDNFKDMSSFVSLKACVERFKPNKIRNFRKVSGNRQSASTFWSSSSTLSRKRCLLNQTECIVFIGHLQQDTASFIYMDKKGQKSFQIGILSIFLSQKRKIIIEVVTCKPSSHTYFSLILAGVYQGGRLMSYAVAKAVHFPPYIYIFYLSLFSTIKYISAIYDMNFQ